MTQVAIVRAIGDGGFQEPRTGTYISSQNDTIVAYTEWVENLVNHDKVKLVELIEGSEYAQFVNHVAEEEGDQDKALAAYRKVMPEGQKNFEKVRVVESPKDLEEPKTEARTGKTNRDAPAASTTKAE